MLMNDFITVLISHLNQIEVKGEKNLDLLLSTIQALKGLQDGSILSAELRDQLNKEVQNGRNNQDTRRNNGQS